MLLYTWMVLQLSIIPQFSQMVLAEIYLSPISVCILVNPLRSGFLSLSIILYFLSIHISIYSYLYSTPVMITRACWTPLLMYLPMETVPKLDEHKSALKPEKFRSYFKLIPLSYEWLAPHLAAVTIAQRTFMFIVFSDLLFPSLYTIQT